MNLLLKHGALATAASLAACAGHAVQTALPPQIAPAANQVLALTVAARGVQIYECRAGSDGARGQWAFVAPDAELLDAAGRTIGRHGAGPHWTFDDATPAARAVPGRVTARVTGSAPAPQADAIAWLRLEAPAGAAGGARTVLRIHTRGGQAPGAPCEGSEFGRRVRVPYGADYLFYTPRSDTAAASIDSTSPRSWKQ